MDKSPFLVAGKGVNHNRPGRTKNEERRRPAGQAKKIQQQYSITNSSRNTKASSGKAGKDAFTTQEFAETMKKVREEAESSMKTAAETMKHFYDKRRSDSIKYKVGDLVWLEGTNIQTTRPAKKLDHIYQGPCPLPRRRRSRPTTHSEPAQHRRPPVHTITTPTRSTKSSRRRTPPAQTSTRESLLATKYRKSTFSRSTDSQEFSASNSES
jgi:hypothetical protein